MQNVILFLFFYTDATYDMICVLKSFYVSHKNCFIDIIIKLCVNKTKL